MWKWITIKPSYPFLSRQCKFNLFILFLCCARPRHHNKRKMIMVQIRSQITTTTWRGWISRRVGKKETKSWLEKKGEEMLCIINTSRRFLSLCAALNFIPMQTRFAAGTPFVGLRKAARLYLLLGGQLQSELLLYMLLLLLFPSSSSSSWWWMKKCFIVVETCRVFKEL